jgi:hypothetical protein
VHFAANFAVTLFTGSPLSSKILTLKKIFNAIPGLIGGYSLIFNSFVGAYLCQFFPHNSIFKN